MKQIEDYLHLYIGCEAVTVLTKPEIVDGHMIDLVRNGYYHAKPVLRPLSSMSQDEADEFHGVNVKLQHYVFYLNTREYWNPKEFKWLLSKHFDLFGLIEAGLAVALTPVAIVKDAVDVVTGSEPENTKELLKSVGDDLEQAIDEATGG